MSDRVMVMDEGEIIACGTPQRVGETLKNLKHPLFCAMPSPMRIYASVESRLPCPVTICDGRKWLNSLLDIKLPVKESGMVPVDTTACIPLKSNTDTPVVRLKDVWFRYAKNLPDTIKGLSLEIHAGQLYCIVGGNGTGKTTALSIISGILTPYRGRVYINGKDILKMSQKEKFQNNLGMLPQNPQALFMKKTVQLDLYEILDGQKISQEQKEGKIRKVAALCELEDLLSMHPYDLSGGEQQRAALAAAARTPNTSAR